MLRTLATLFLGTAALAQNTWIVDPCGTGNFTDLGAAIAAAAPFDRLVLRGAGFYQATYVIGKPLAIVGDNAAGRSFVTGLRIQSTTPIAVPVTISGVELGRLVALQPVTIEDAAIRGCEINTTAAFHSCVFGFPPPSNHPDTPFLLTGGRAIVTDSTLYAGAPYGVMEISGCVGYAGSPAVVASQGDLTLASCSIEGAHAWIAHCGGPYTAWTPPGPAVSIGSATVRFTNCGVNSTAAQSVVHASIPVYYDPSAVFYPALQGGTAIFLPATRGQGAMPGGTMHCNVFTTSLSRPAALAGSLGMRNPVTTTYGTTWLDPNAFVVLALGITNAAGQLAASIPLPATAPRGLPITVQGFVAVPTSGNLQAASPVVLHVQ